MAKLLSFHGKQEIKDEYIARVKAHGISDEIVKGQYWEDGKGCAVGCTIHGSNHLAYEKELGIPFDLAIYEDKIFESLPNDEAKTFPLEFLEAIPVGVNLEKIGLKLSLWVVADKKEGILSKVTRKQDVDFLTKLSKILNKEITDTATEKDRQQFKAYASASASSYAYAYTCSYAYLYASAFASAYAYASASSSTYAYASAYAYASSYAYVYASSYASAYASDCRKKLIQLLKKAK